MFPASLGENAAIVRHSLVRNWLKCSENAIEVNAHAVSYFRVKGQIALFCVIVVFICIMLADTCRTRQIF